MKKISMLLIIGLITILMVGCGGETNVEEESGKSNGNEVSQETGEVEDQVEEAEKEDKNKTVAIGDEFKVGPYLVKVNSIKRIKDYEDNDAIVINCDWTNESEETTSWLGSMYMQVFQDGVQLENAIVMEGMDSDKSMKDVRPGTKLEGIENAFNTTSTNALEIEVEAMEEFFSDKAVLILADYPAE